MKTKEEIRIEFYGKDDARAYDNDELYIMQAYAAQQQNFVTMQKCPKCDGQGIVSKPPYIAGDQSTWTSNAGSYTCNLCKGAMMIPVIPANQHPEPTYQQEKDAFFEISRQSMADIIQRDQPEPTKQEDMK
jgi:hypothetical protein